MVLWSPNNISYATGSSSIGRLRCNSNRLMTLSPRAYRSEVIRAGFFTPVTSAIWYLVATTALDVRTCCQQCDIALPMFAVVYYPVSQLNTVDLIHLSCCIRDGVCRVAASYDQQRLDAAGGNRLVDLHSHPDQRFASCNKVSSLRRRRKQLHAHAL
eukprot:COSAG06_NODE_8591_length_2122_cov_0.898171_2_plen_157_part_00